jgi:hypothetical protein
MKDRLCSVSFYINLIRCGDKGQLNIFSRSFRRQDSFASDANSESINSQTTSARHLLPGMNFNNNSSVHDYDSAHFTPPNRSAYSMNADNISLASSTNLSLSVNYIPSKFAGFRNRKGGKYDDEPNLPKSGGGIHAFGSNESRMSQGKGSLRWNKFKWVLFATNSLVWFPVNPCLLPFLKPYTTAHALFCCCSRRLSANVVRRLGKVGCHTYGEHTRTNPLNNGSRHWSLNLSYRLGRYSPQ